MYPLFYVCKCIYLCYIGNMILIIIQVRLQEVFESRTRIFIVQELEYGGELFDRYKSLQI